MDSIYLNDGTKTTEPGEGEWRLVWDYRIDFITVRSHSVEFQVYEHRHMQEENELCMDGFLKWDGCCEWTTHSVHICGPEDVTLTARILAAVFKHCESLEHFDYLGDKLAIEPMPTCEGP